jgi:hypothetical protein
VGRGPNKPLGTKKPGTGLARPGDPLITGRGEIVEPENKPTKKEAKKLEITDTIDPALFRPTKRRIMKELPAAPNVITGIGAVFMYTMMGVGDREIAETLGITVEYLSELRSHPAYGECFTAIHEEFINANSGLLTSRIASYAQDALTTVGTLSQMAKKEEVKLSASKDLLDRAGVRPKDQEQRVSMSQNDLRIILVDGNRSANVNITIGEENGDRG